PAIAPHVDLGALDLTNPAAKPVKISTSAGGNFSPAYSPDGKYLAWRSQARAGYESDKFRLMLYDRTARTAKDMLPQNGTWVDEFVWGPDSTRILLTSGLAVEEPVIVVDLNGRLANLELPGEFSALHPLPNGKTVVVSWMTVQRPTEVATLTYIMSSQKCGADCYDKVARIEP